MATDSSLDPRLDMIWKESMDAWKPAGQIDGLFERMSVPVKAEEPLAPPAPTVRAPKESVRKAMVRSGPWPGARRRSLLFVAFVLPFAWKYGLQAGGPFLTEQFGQMTMSRIQPIAALVPVFALIWFGIRRLENLGMSRMWFLGFFAPFLNLWVAYRCLACPAGYAYHKKLDGSGIAIAILYWATAVILTAYIASLYGAIDSTGLLEHAKNLIKIK